MEQYLINPGSTIKLYFCIRTTLHKSRPPKWWLHGQFEYSLVETIHLKNSIVTMQNIRQNQPLQMQKPDCKKRKNVKKQGHKYQKIHTSSIHDIMSKRNSTMPLKPLVSAPCRTLSEISVTTMKTTLDPAHCYKKRHNWYLLQLSITGTAQNIQSLQFFRENTYSYPMIIKIVLCPWKRFSIDAFSNEFEHIYSDQWKHTSISKMKAESYFWIC